MPILQLLNLEAIDKLTLETGSKTHITDASKYNVDHTTREGGSKLKFGKDVTKDERLGILTKVKSDTKSDIGVLKESKKAAAEEDKHQFHSEIKNLRQGVRQTNKQIKKTEGKKLMLLLI